MHALSRAETTCKHQCSCDDEQQQRCDQHGIQGSVSCFSSLTTTTLHRWFPSRRVGRIQLPLNAVQFLFCRGSVHASRMPQPQSSAARPRARARSLSQIITRVIAHASATPNRIESSDSTAQHLRTPAGAGCLSICRSDQGMPEDCCDQSLALAFLSLGACGVACGLDAALEAREASKRCSCASRRASEMLRVRSVINWRSRQR